VNSLYYLHIFSKVKQSYKIKVYQLKNSWLSHSLAIKNIAGWHSVLQFSALWNGIIGCNYLIKFESEFNEKMCAKYLVQCLEYRRYTTIGIIIPVKFLKGQTALLSNNHLNRRIWKFPLFADMAILKYKLAGEEPQRSHPKPMCSD
jgi:hypothetical protein